MLNHFLQLWLHLESALLWGTHYVLALVVIAILFAVEDEVLMDHNVHIIDGAVVAGRDVLNSRNA